MPPSLSYQEIITATIAVVAVVISLVSLRRTSKVQRQQLRLQEKEELIDLQLESLRNQAMAIQAPAQEKADVRVDLVREGKNYKFVITNWGRVPARNITFQIEKQEGKSSPLVKGDYDKKIPISELAPGSRISIIAALSFGTGTSFHGVWTWRNPDGSEERRSSVLAI